MIVLLAVAGVAAVLTTSPALAQMTYESCVESRFTTAADCASLLVIEDGLDPYTTGFLVGLLIAVAAFCLVAMSVWSREGGDATTGFLFGLLGPLGLFYVAFANPGYLRCYACKVMVPDDATICFRCHTDLSDEPARPPDEEPKRPFTSI